MKMPIKILLLLIMNSIFNLSYADTLLQGNLKLQIVTDNIYAIVGPMNNRTPENLGNNSTSGFIVTKQGVVLIDAGGSYKGAQNIHNVIKSVTSKPITYVINTGGQDHRWLGNGYFKSLGAKIIANVKAVKDQKSRTQDQFFMLNNLVGEAGMEGTEAVYADTTFDKTMSLKVGEYTFEIIHITTAHTPGDSFVWLPNVNVLFSGDIIFTDRLLGILEHSSSKGWIESFKAIATLRPRLIIPGHGDTTTLKTATSDTLTYLEKIRASVIEFMDEDGDISDISQVDQSSFSHLISFDTLSGRNAQRVYSELEWE